MIKHSSNLYIRYNTICVYVPKLDNQFNSMYTLSFVSSVVFPQFPIQLINFVFRCFQFHFCPFESLNHLNFRLGLVSCAMSWNIAKVNCCVWCLDEEITNSNLFATRYRLQALASWRTMTNYKGTLRNINATSLWRLEIS